jgi:hypothetical protein
MRVVAYMFREKRKKPVLSSRLCLSLLRSCSCNSTEKTALQLAGRWSTYGLFRIEETAERSLRNA